MPTSGLQGRFSTNRQIFAWLGASDSTIDRLVRRLRFPARLQQRPEPAPPGAAVVTGASRRQDPDVQEHARAVTNVFFR